MPGTMAVNSGESCGAARAAFLGHNEVDLDFSWEPPSEAEAKVMEARRERQEKISKLMGEYLLKGYRLLGDSCEECGTILLQDRQRKNYCVACMELDSDVDKDNPALNAQAARSQVRERQMKGEPEVAIDGAEERAPRPAGPRAEPAGLALPDIRPGPSPGQGAPVGATAPPPASSMAGMSQNATTVGSLSQASAMIGDCPTARGLDAAEQAVLAKLQWASRELAQAASVEASTQLCCLVKACADSLLSLRKLM
uniref:protein ZNRD2 n=1 Tax=Myxine glutinosa TaxID=7769 RepID=UPI00358F6456